MANTYCLNFIQIGGIWICSGGRKPLLGGLNLTCDAHFWTWWSYSSQKSCVKIWFGLVEIRGMLISRGGGGAEAPYYYGLIQEMARASEKCWLNTSTTTTTPIRRGYMWPAMSILEPGQATPVKSRVKIWFGLIEPFKSYRGHKQTNIKKNHRCNWKQHASERNFSGA